MKFDPRVTYALILALLLETAGGLIWAGRASARLEEVERAVAVEREIVVRLTRVEEQLAAAQRSLVRIERRLETL